MSDRYLVPRPTASVTKDGEWSTIPNSFKKNFSHIIKLVHKVVKASNKDKIWSIDELELSCIYSSENSSMQQLHFDYNGDWDKFDQVQEEFKVTPLSLLHFPEGGHRVVYEGESLSSKISEM